MSINGISNTFDPITLSGLTLNDSLSGTYVPYSGANQATNLNNQSISNVSSLAVVGTVSGSTITSSGTVSGSTVSGTTINGTNITASSALTGTTINGTNITASSALAGNTSAITLTETIGLSLMVGSYYNVPSIQVTAANQILVSVTSIPASWIAGDQVKIVAFNQTVFNTTMTILSVTGSGFYSSFISGLPNGTYTSPTSYVYNYNNISIGTISGINVTAINTISANFLNAFLGAQIASLACTGTTSTQTLTSSTLFTASGGGINTNTLYATGLITAGAGISSFNNLISNGAMIVNGSSNPANGTSAVWTRFESLALGGTITCGTFGTGYLPLSINSSVSDFTINGTSKMTLEATGNLNAKTSITTPNTSTGLLQAYNNGLNTSSSTTIISTVTDWTTSMGSFATVTSSAGLRGAGFGIAVDSTGNTWALTLEPSVAWKNFNQVASSYSYYTNTFGSATPVLNINSNGTSTFRSNILLKGNSSKGTEQANGPNLVCYVSSDSYARPALSTFTYDHNDMALMFDIYFVSGTGFVTSYNAINWMFQKYGDTMAFRYVPATTAGSTVTPVTTLLLTSSATIVQSNPLLLKGPVNQYSTSATGPNIKSYVDSDSYAYPTISTFNYNHNNNAIQFDMYYNAGWYSSFNSVNWQIYKNTDRLFFQYINAVAAGTAGPLQNMMVLTNTGVVISPTSGSYVAANVLHLIKDVSAIGDTSLMITWENTVGGYYDFLAGYYREPLGGGTWQVRGGTTSYTTALPLLTVYYNGFVGVNGVQSPAYALDTGNSSVGCNSVVSANTLTMTTGTSSNSFAVYNGGDGSMILNQNVYHNISQKANLTSGSVGAWQGGLLISRYASQGTQDSGMLLGYSDTLGSGIIISLQPSIVWRNLYFYAQTFYYYYQGTLAGYINAGGFVNVSDEREKEDIKPLKTTRSLERVLACKTVTYKRKCTDPLTTEDTKNKSHIGLLAQQTCESNPHCISQWENEEKKERLGIQYNDYVVHLIGAVQELHKESLERNEKIKILEATILAQNNKLELFEAHLIQLTNQLNNITLNK